MTDPFLWNSSCFESTEPPRGGLIHENTPFPPYRDRAMRRVFVLLLLVLPCACAGEPMEATTTTAISATTSTSQSAPTLVPGGLIQADPATLVPYEDANPIVIGAAHGGVASSNGRWAAVATRDEPAAGVISLIDLETMTVTRSTEGSADGLVVSDAGVAYWFEDGFLTGLSHDEEWIDIQFPGPVLPALATTLLVSRDGRVMYVLGGEDEAEPVRLVLVDGSEIEDIAVPGIVAGPITPTHPDVPSHEAITPSLAWDEANDRALVISATANEVVEVDLATSAMTSHRFESPVSPGAGQQSVRRDSFVSASGEILLIATRSLTVTGDADDNWHATDSAADLTVVDTTDWSSEVLTQSISSLEASPDRTYVAGTGASISSSWDAEGEILQSPIYLIDGVTGVPVVGFEGRSGTIVDTQFSADSAELYVISESEEGTNIDIIDVATTELAGSLGFARISLVGEAGLIAFHLE